jgi:hypothetical protein
MLWLMLAVATTFSSCNYGNMRNEVIVENEDITVTSDSVTMGQFTAYSPDGHSIVTNYQSSGIDSIDNVIKFRLLTGERDIELLPAQYHYIDIDNITDSMTIKAFEADTVKPQATHRIALPQSVNLRIDMSQMVDALNMSGTFVTPTRDTIYSQDFEKAKLEMDIHTSIPAHTLKIRLDEAPSNGGIYSVTVPLDAKQQTKYSGWTSTINAQTTAMPAYDSKQNILNAIYNMSIEQVETVTPITPTLVASECYDIALSLAYLQPNKSMETLKAMVVDSIIHCEEGEKSLASMCNDMIWAHAAWSVYCATGDKAWLSYAYKVIIKSLTKINEFATNRETGLYHALCPYTLRFASQYYPIWATASDAYETMPLIANAIIEHSYALLGQIADEFELNEDHDTQASRLKDAINHRLWNETRGCYSQYLYGGVTSIVSPCVDNMGHAMAILWDIADDNRTEALIKETPITNYGVPLIYPNRAGVGTGLNNTVIPMVQAMWNLAAAKANNMGMLRRGMGALIFQQAMAASCNTCCNATTGEILDYGNPQGNAAGNLAMVFRVLAGMNFLPDGIELNPKVPVCFDGKKTITGFTYRSATLNITIKGTGDDFKKITLDGKTLDDNFINGDLEGEHDIVITMNDNYTGSGVTTVAEKMKVLPETPQWLWDGYYGTNYNYTPTLGYQILINGEPTYSMRDSVLGTRDTVTYRNYTIVAINKYGHSYISQPHYITSTARCYHFANLYPQLASSISLPVASSHHPIELDDSTAINITVNVEEAGTYVFDVFYANGNGPQSWNQPCQLLQVLTNSHNQGVVTVTQLGEDQWMLMNYSSHLPIKLLKGKNILTLRRVKLLGEQQTTSPLLLDHLRLIKQQSKS